MAREILSETLEKEDFHQPGKRETIREAAERLRKLGHLPEGVNTISFDALELDAETQSAKVNGKPIHFTLTEFSLICALASKHGEPITNPDLFKAGWGDIPYDESTREYLKVYTKRLRDKLDQSGATSQIVSTRGKGYTLVPSSIDG